MVQHGVVQFPPQRMCRKDREIAADVGNHCTDRAAAHLGSDFLLAWQAREWRVRCPAPVLRGSRGVRRTRRRRTAGRSRCTLPTGGQPEQLRLQRGGAHQAARDAQQNQGEIDDTVIFRHGDGVDDRVGTAQRGSKLLAVVDEPAHQAAQPPEPVWRVRAGARPILEGIGTGRKPSSGQCGGHGCIRTEEEHKVKDYFLAPSARASSGLPSSSGLDAIDPPMIRAHHHDNPQRLVGRCNAAAALRSQPVRPGQTRDAMHHCYSRASPHHRSAAERLGRLLNVSVRAAELSACHV